jgi:IclR family acetate operon transcriptional repressor
MTTQTVRAVERAIDVLDVIKTSGGAAGVSEISQEVGLAKSTVHRILVALSNKGVVHKDGDTELYSFGHKVFEFAFAASQYQDIVSLVIPYLEELRDRLDETAALALKIGLKYIYVAQVPSLHEYRVNPVLGIQYPLHWSGTGKAILAFVSDDELEKCLGVVPFLRSTARTVADPAMLLEQLKEIRRVGYSISFGERSEGAAAIASPIRDRRGLAQAAISIVGPELRFRQMDPSAMGKVVAEVRCRVEVACQASGLEIAALPTRQE